eukprot:CAMPEP_0115510480 /NCGR_PEP_ID=MMETSP0271-20121206/73438_1 /TAXON_ID=71861 /ORGANISM="Scrippsiella trochoidea, Strain CCMP3099" /LENGTH=146 /DNA_ID=CAMNT_0002940453 /DNA_START=12 /DNA_END=448 /DNA_ORIENTATION=+
MSAADGLGSGTSREPVSECPVPTRDKEVDDWIKEGLVDRLDEREAARLWRRYIELVGDAGVSASACEELRLTYFDCCPKLALVREFFERAPTAVLRHRHCGENSSWATPRLDARPVFSPAFSCPRSPSVGCASMLATAAAAAAAAA